MHKKKLITSQMKMIGRNSGASTLRTSAELLKPSQAELLLCQFDLGDFAVGTASSICMGENILITN